MVAVVSDNMHKVLHHIHDKHAVVLLLFVVGVAATAAELFTTGCHHQGTSPKENVRPNIGCSDDTNDDSERHDFDAKRINERRNTAVKRKARATPKAYRTNKGYARRTPQADRTRNGYGAQKIKPRRR